MVAHVPGGGDPGGSAAVDSSGGGMDCTGAWFDACGGGRIAPSQPDYSRSPEHSAAAALARAVVASPAKTSQRWGSSLGGVE